LYKQISKLGPDYRPKIQNVMTILPKIAIFRDLPIFIQIGAIFGNVKGVLNNFLVGFRGSRHPVSVYFCPCSTTLQYFKQPMFFGEFEFWGWATSWGRHWRR